MQLLILTAIAIKMFNITNIASDECVIQLISSGFYHFTEPLRPIQIDGGFQVLRKVFVITIFDWVIDFI